MKRKRKREREKKGSRGTTSSRKKARGLCVYFSVRLATFSTEGFHRADMFTALANSFDEL